MDPRGRELAGFGGARLNCGCGHRTGEGAKPSNGSGSTRVPRRMCIPSNSLASSREAVPTATGPRHSPGPPTPSRT